MNTNYNVIRMTKRDYLSLPYDMRQLSDGPMVLTMRDGMETFVRVEILE